MDQKFEFSVHLYGVICWLPAHKPERKRFPSGTNFRALAKFTSDFSANDMTVLVNYSPFQLNNQPDCYDVRLHFAFLDGKDDEIKRLSKNCEVIIMDAYKVIAVCRNIFLPDSKTLNISREW